MPDLPKIIRHSLLSAALDRDTLVERVEVARVELGPGQETGLHRHPCPVVGCVLSGTIRFQVAREPEMTLQAGDAFVEPANVDVAHFDNPSHHEPAAFLACYLLPPGETRLIEMLA
jgi:quercetin dioxygenase-like cupin family protein